MPRKATEAEAGAPPVITKHIEHATAIVAAYVSHNMLPQIEVPSLIRSIHDTLISIADGTADKSADHKPAVPIKKSVFDDHIVCLEDGKKLTMLKRYLMSQYKMTPEDYRRKWGLPPDYPMVAPAYARLRSAFAKKIGLGRVAVARAPRKGK